MAALDAAIHARRQAPVPPDKKINEFQIITITPESRSVFSPLRSVDGRDNPRIKSGDGHDEKARENRSPTKQELSIANFLDKNRRHRYTYSLGQNRFPHSALAAARGLFEPLSHNH